MVAYQKTYLHLHSLNFIPQFTVISYCLKYMPEQRRKSLHTDDFRFTYNVVFDPQSEIE
jgi:hypothetical protein